MRDDQLDALVAAADEGIDCDGLVAAREDDGYVLETPDGRRAGLDADALRDAAREHAPLVTNWHYWARLDPGTDARRAFLRWIERADDRGVRDRYDALADGVGREWGQLSITTRLADHGERRYAIRHADDAAADPDDLDAYDDPLDARELAKFDGRGRYRPLKTAPTLRTGWRFVGLDGRECVRAVDFFYPATIENWHLERAGELDVAHWRDAAERQTGIYDVVDELPREAVAWAAEACCVDSQCLKRRRWEHEEGDPIDVDRGDGAFPCREPCSLLIAAAREWALAEREEPRTYEVELTPTEKEQVEAIVDAVAEGRVDEIREGDFDDPANRYRARYLRAKRFADGFGEPVDPDG